MQIRNRTNSAVNYLFLLLLILPASLLFADTLTERIDEYLKTVYLNKSFNGTVMYAEKGKILYNKSFGIANYQTMENIQSNSPFRLASVSKAFTAMSIMILAEKEKLNYGDDIRKYLAEWPYPGMTVRHLLNHTSGVPDYIALLDEHWDIPNKGTPNRKIATGYDAFDMLVKHQPPAQFQPGEKWEYSNSGYVLLALIVENISGKIFDQFLQDHIFGPLEMRQTLLYSPVKDPYIYRRVYGYRLGEDGKYAANDEHYVNGMFGDGEVYSVPADLLKWDQALYTEKLVSKKTLEMAFSPTVLNDGSTYDYGFGWGIGEIDGKRIVEHDGGWVGFRTTLHREIEDNRTLVILTNNSCENYKEIKSTLKDIIHNRPTQSVE